MFCENIFSGVRWAVLKKTRRSEVDPILVVLLCAVTFISTFSQERRLKNVSIDIVEIISNSRKKTIAVVDFVDLQGSVTELGRFLAEELSIELTSSNKTFEVIDRSHLKTILSEHKLSVTGLIDL